MNKIDRYLSLAKMWLIIWAVLIALRVVLFSVEVLKYGWNMP